LRQLLPGAVRWVVHLILLGKAVYLLTFHQAVAQLVQLLFHVHNLFHAAVAGRICGDAPQAGARVVVDKPKRFSAYREGSSASFDA
jgi:hypothetical protein